MSAFDARPPLRNMGTRMLGPTLLEYGTEDPKAATLDCNCRGRQTGASYSEPGAGSDLAGLRTQADDHGDHFVINGQKI